MRSSEHLECLPGRILLWTVFLFQKFPFGLCRNYNILYRYGIIELMRLVGELMKGGSRSHFLQGTANQSRLQGSDNTVTDYQGVGS